MRSTEGYLKRREDVVRRAGTPDPMYSYCRAFSCPNPARGGTKDGLGHQYCRSHSEHHQRHGSPFKGSYRARELNPYRQAALQWLLDHEDEYWTKVAIQKVQALYRHAGPHIEAFRLRGLSPKVRAKAHWARLRKHEIDPHLVVAAWLAVEMILKDDSHPVLKPEYKRVQAAKVVHRMASGSHRRWVREFASGTHTEELHAYPRPRGRVLRHIGKDLEEACELLVDYHLDDVSALKKERDKTGKFDLTPSG